MNRKNSIIANNYRHVLLYISITFITVVTVVSFASYSIETYRVNAFNHENQTINLQSIETKKIHVGDIDMR
jgi:hypothetical protein